MNLSVKKLRRSATIVGGSFLGLGIAAALATPALACKSDIVPTVSCLSANGSWSVTWAVSSSDKGVQGTIVKVETTPPNAALTNIAPSTKDKPVVIPSQGEAPLTGVETLGADDSSASLKLVVSYPIGRHGEPRYVTDYSSVNKPTEYCTPPTKPSTPPTKQSTPPTTKTATPPATTPGTPAPSSSGPVLAITGSSSAPLAGGAVALVAVGGGAFFLARRRKMKFTA